MREVMKLTSNQEQLSNKRKMYTESLNIDILNRPIDNRRRETQVKKRFQFRVSFLLIFFVIHFYSIKFY